MAGARTQLLRRVPQTAEPSGSLLKLLYSKSEQLPELLQFVRTLEHQVGPDACAQVRPDYDYWLSELEVSLKMQCEQCGATLSCDMLGIEAYRVGTYCRACPHCYDRLQDRTHSLGRRWARLIVHAADHPELLAGPLARWQYRLGLSDWQVEQRLSLDANGLLRLVLSPIPDLNHRDQQCQLLATTLGCPADLIAQLVAEDDSTILDQAVMSTDDVGEELPF
jgi:hypothetical protein